MPSKLSYSSYSLPIGTPRNPSAPRRRVPRGSAPTTPQEPGAGGGVPTRAPTIPDGATPVPTPPRQLPVGSQWGATLPAGSQWGPVLRPRPGRVASGPAYPFPAGPRASTRPGVINVPQMPYQPAAPHVRAITDPLTRYGQGLLEPGSDYARRLQAEAERRVGEQTGAAQRGAALRAAGAGMGMGASGELLETQRDIGVAGQRQAGQEVSDLIRGGPQLAMQLLGPALGAELGLQGSDLRAWLGQQELIAQQEAERARQAQYYNDMLMRQLAALYGGF